MSKLDTQNLRKDVAYSAVKNSKEELEVDSYGPVPTIGARHWQCVCHFILLFFGFGNRVILSVAIVAMTDPSASVNPDIPTYPDWTQKGAILSAFFWGYIWPQVLAGYVANKFGAKWFLIGTMGIQSALSVLIPYIAAQFGPVGLMATRAIQGFCQGFFFPTLTHLASQWIPQQERARLSSLTFGSVPFGTVVAIFVSGLIAASPYGWPMVFYFYGGGGLFWCILFTFFGYNSPAEHPTINRAEKYYIEKSLGHTDEKPSHNIPWKAIFTSVPCWALLLTQMGFVFGFWILLSQIPTYMSHVMNFNIKDNSLLSSLPYLTQFMLSVVLGFISDFIINKKFITQTKSRKLFNTIGCIIPAAALIFLAYTKSDEPYRAVFLLILAVGISSASMAGWGLNHMDLTPNYAGTLMGLCNAVSNITAILAPLMVQFLVKDENNPEQWKIIFFMAAGGYIITSIIFILFGSGEIQSWNYYDQDKNADKEKTTL